MLTVQYSGHVCSFETITRDIEEAAGVSARRWALYLSVMKPGIEKAKRHGEDHIRDPTECVPRDDQSQHGVAGLVDPI